MNLVVDLALIEFSGHTNYEAQPFLVVLLTENGSYDSVRSVSVQDVRLVPVRESEDTVAEKTLFQLLERSLLCGFPVPDSLPG